jgi:hypothetical protein
MHPQRTKLSRAVVESRFNPLDRRVMISGMAFVVGMGFVVGAYNTLDMPSADNTHSTIYHYTIPDGALAAHEAPKTGHIGVSKATPAVASPQVVTKVPAISFNQAVNQSLIDNTDQEIGTTTYRLGGRVAPTLLGEVLPERYVDCSGWTAANTLAAMTAINDKFGNVYNMPEMVAVMNSVAADQVRIVAHKTGHIIGNAEIRAGKDLHSGMLIGVGGMDDGRFEGIGHIGQVVEQNGQLFVSDSKRLAFQDGVSLTPLKDWLADTKGEPLYAVDPFTLTTAEGKKYAATAFAGASLRLETFLSSRLFLFLCAQYFSNGILSNVAQET